MIPVLETTASPKDQKPTVAFFEGVDAVKNVIMEMLYCKGKEIHSIVPKENFFWEIGQDFVELFVEERVRRSIKTKNLWEASISKELMKQYYDGLSQVRILPHVMHGHFKTTIFMYDDKTLYVSSKNNSYCVLMTSEEHTETMQACFDGLWGASHPHRK
jgi:hypothetical protein